jgi:Domain of unknown function (DUF4267)
MRGEPRGSEEKLGARECGLRGGGTLGGVSHRKEAMLHDVAYGLCGLIGLGIIFVGARFLLAPVAAAADFGVAVEQDGGDIGAYLSVKGVRDIVSGIFVIILLVDGAPRLLAWFVLAATLIPVGDALIVLRNRGPKVAVYGWHGGTAALMLVTAGLLFFV